MKTTTYETNLAALMAFRFSYDIPEFYHFVERWIYSYPRTKALNAEILSRALSHWKKQQWEKERAHRINFGPITEICPILQAMYDLDILELDRASRHMDRRYPEAEPGPDFDISFAKDLWGKL